MTRDASSRLGQIGRNALVIVLTVGCFSTLGSAPARAETIRQQQWYYDTLRINEAHRSSTGSGVTVAVIDSGVDQNVPDLAGHVQPGIDLSGANTDGRVDTNGHGTAMASIIVGGGVPGGMAGIAPDAQIFPIRVTVGQLTATDEVAQAIRDAADRHAGVINLSLGVSRDTSSALSDAVHYAIDAGSVVVAAAGNTGAPDGSSEISSPANIDGVVAVTGLTGDGEFWSESREGPRAVISAPASHIAVAEPVAVSPTGYALVDGTSAASAIVSASAALVRAKFPSLPPTAIVHRLITTASDAGPPGRDPEYGYGRLSPVSALTANVDNAVSVVPISPSSSPSVERRAVAHKRGELHTADAMAAIAVLALLAGVALIWAFQRRNIRR